MALQKKILLPMEQKTKTNVRLNEECWQTTAFHDVSPEVSSGRTAAGIYNYLPAGKPVGRGWQHFIPS